MKIIDNNNKEVSEAATLKQYFGLNPNQTLTDYMTDIRKLTPVEKTELAHGAAKELGWTVTQ
jgi:hypothetical protein